MTLNRIEKITGPKINKLGKVSVALALAAILQQNTNANDLANALRN